MEKTSMVGKSVEVETLWEAREALNSGKIRIPLQVIPSYVLERDRQNFVRNEAEFDDVIRKALNISPIAHALLVNLETALFENKPFVSCSGIFLPFKINCDALLEEDIETLAGIIAKKFQFKKVYGVPRGGVRLAKALEKYLSSAGPVLIVDDVLTTGKSMEEAKEKFTGEDLIGIVIFARNKCPLWVKAMFAQESWIEQDNPAP